MVSFYGNILSTKLRNFVLSYYILEMFVLQLPDTKGSLIILNSRRKNRTFDNVKICQQEGYCFRFLFAACPSFRTSFVSRLSDSAENTLSFNQSTKKRNAQKIHCSNIVLFVNNSLMSILFFGRAFKMKLSFT